MFKNFNKILFFFMLMLGTIISISANSWMNMWMGMEINLLSFIPLLTNKNNLNYSEASLNYFLVQAFASTIFLFSLIMMMITSNMLFFILIFNNIKFNLLNFMIIMTLMLKLGMAPFHLWFPNMMNYISWNNSLILMTWQKITPMMIMTYILNLNIFFLIFIMMSSLIGALGGLNQSSLRKLLAFSSINHMSWMMIAIMFNENLWLIYFLIYLIMNFSIIYIFKIFQIFYMSQLYTLLNKYILIKFMLMINMLSLGGLPPFLGFFSKWLIIQTMIMMKMNFISFFLIIMSLITLYYYLKISFSAFLLNYFEFNWNIKNYLNNNSMINIMKLNLISSMSFFPIFNLINLI